MSLHARTQLARFVRIFLFALAPSISTAILAKNPWLTFLAGVPAALEFTFRQIWPATPDAYTGPPAHDVDATR